jgi:filamentous hemagglutinin family protein
MLSRQKVLIALALAPMAIGSALAGPNGATVVNGNATIHGQGSSSVVVNQSSQNAIINWQTFNIGSGQTVQILMPNSSSAELDRVTGNLGPSQIYGSLSSNGQVFLVNPNGILFGQGAQINVGSLLATTSNISNADFMAGRYNFSIPGNPSASIVNQGTITAKTGGFAALVAPGVRNTGTITAWLGRVGLASANTFALDLYGDRLIQLNVDDSIASQVIDVSTGQPLKALVSNEGKLKANGGTVQLTAVAARAVVDSVINNSGVIEADSIGTHNGMIVLSAATASQKPSGAPTQTVTVSGKLSAAGKRKGTTGGTVLINGENIALNGATIDASGNAGGGTVQIGGNGSSANASNANASSANSSSASGSDGLWGGGPAGAAPWGSVTASSSNPNTNLGAGLIVSPAAGQTTNQAANQSLATQTASNASTVTIDAATVINASATASGNGGTVTVWSDLATAFYGTILAKGGAQGGNGGFVETSGGTLAFTGTVNTSAPNGKTGTWLLDPVDLTVDSSTAAAISSSLANTSIMLQTTATGANGPGIQSSGAGDITINAPISWSSANTLTIDAYNAIIFNASINVMGAGGLALSAANNPLATAAPLISFNNGASAQFTGTPNSGQSLSINGQAYTLLYSMADVQNINNNLGGYYALALPLDASGVTNWTPIGTDGGENVLSGGGFAGAFQGLGNTISNLTINLPSTSYVGLFGYSSGLIQNLGLVGGSVTGNSTVGGLIGLNNGTVTNAYTTGAVTGSGSGASDVGGLIGYNLSGTVTNAYTTGAVIGGSGSGSSVGGLIGLIYSGTVTNAYATGAVTGGVRGSSSNVGGLVGLNGGAVSDAYATGAVIGGGGFSNVGGLIGNNLLGTVTNAYATGAVTGGGGSGSSFVGGLIGINQGTVSDAYATGAVSGSGSSPSVGGLIGQNYFGTVTNAYATGVVTGAGSLGGLVGSSSSGTISQSYWDISTSGIGGQNGVGNVANAPGVTGLTTAQFGNAANFVGWNFGTTPGGSGWVIVDSDGSLNNANGASGATRPMLLSEWSTTITNPHQLQLMELAPNANYTLANNIDLGPALANASEVWGPNGSAGFVPIGLGGAAPFTGTFNGNGNIISNLMINLPLSEYVGLFGLLSSGGLIENVGIAGGSVTGNSEVGGLVGGIFGTVQNAYATDAVTGNSYVGGLVGGSSGLVSQSYATGTVTGNSGSSLVGGLIGANGGGTVTQSYAIGAVIAGPGSSSVGGLIGGNGGNVTSSYWNIQTSGQTVSDGGTGLTTAQFQSGLPNGFAATVWGSNPNVNNGYPYLLQVSPSGGLQQFVEGIVYINGTPVGAGVTVYDLVNGTSYGSVTTAANGSYEFVLPLGTISALGSQVLTYTTNGGGGAAFAQNVSSSLTNFNIYLSYLNLTSSVNTLSAISSGLATAIGSNTAAQTLVGGLSNRQINATAANFTIDQAISLTGDLIVNASGNVTATSGINVGSFTLQNGNWSQVEAALPSFTAQNFTIAGGSFLRATGGDGSSGSPYQITDIYGLQGIGSSATLLADNYVLANNIDASGTANWNGGAGFLPIATSGTFNGNGNTISNLTINLPNSNLAVGLFGLVGTGGLVENVGLLGGSVTGGALTPYVGALVGENLGTVTNAYATGTVSGGFYVGGLVGGNLGNITQSYATGAVNTGSFVAGGLVGQNSGTISQSYATGAVTVGAFGTAGGLVGVNFNCCDANGNPISGASITNSYATGGVSSPGIDVILGGLVGQNLPLSVISNSQAYGNVTSTANLQANNGNCDSNCQYANVGGFVGANYGTITGTSWSTAPTTCAASFTCAMGNVSVGSQGQGGDFVGFNQGIINFAFATGNVSGAAGQPSVNGVYNNQTQLGGFVGDNQGLIANAFATGTVGSAGTQYLSIGGFAGSNEGTISTAFATGAVLAGDNSTAGGFVGGNSPNNSPTICPGCYVGDGYNNNAAITNAQASGNVTVGASSVAGGFASNSAGDNGGGGTFTNITASGAVTAGQDSMVGGLVGVIGLNSTLSDSSAQNTLVASTGPNGIVGGIVGVSFGTISNTTSTAPVNGTGDSYIGGVAGINLGSLNNVAADPAITGTGSSDFIGGIAGLNLGSIDGSSAQVAITSVSSSYVGGITGVNGSFSNETATIPGSSFPNGTITNSSASGSGFSGNVGATQPPSMPALPAWLSNCTNSICSLLVNGSLQPNGNPNPTPTPTPNTSSANNTSTTQQTTQLTQNVNFTSSNNTAPPVITLVDITNVTNGGNGNPGTGGNGDGGNGNGNNGNGSLANGKRGGNGAPPGMRLIDMPRIPLPPGNGLPPLNETRFLSNQLVLQFDTNNLTPQQISALAARFGLTVVAQQAIGMLGRTVYTFSIGNGQSVRDVIRLIEASGLKVAVQPQYSYGLMQDGTAADQGETGDPAQYIVQKLQLAAAHRISKGENVVIAVIDSAIDAEQPDFAGRVIDRYDAGCGSAAPDAHGTGMAGAIASHVQLVGVAPAAKIIAICAFGGSGGGSGGTPEATSVKIIRGLDYAVQHGAKIVNMSFAGPYDPALAQALQIAREKGVLIVAAAGNAGAKSPPLYPGADPNVLAVTATDESDRLFVGANQGNYVALAAPGVNILVPAPDGGVQMTTGTSVATANVSGVAALLLADKPLRTPEEIRAILVATATHLGAKGINPQFGAGLVDPVRALQAVPSVAGRKSAAAAPAERVQ